MDVIRPAALATADAHQPTARPVVVVLFVVLLALPFAVALFSGRPFLEAIDWTWAGLTAAIGLVAVALVWRAFKPAAHTAASFQGAELALGMLVTARSTGSEINDQPELELTLDIPRADGSTTRGTTKAVIDVGALPQFLPGVLIPAYHLPDGRIAIAFDATDEQVEALRAG